MAGEIVEERGHNDLQQNQQLQHHLQKAKDGVTCGVEYCLKMSNIELLFETLNRKRENVEKPRHVFINTSYKKCCDHFQK